MHTLRICLISLLLPLIACGQVALPWSKVTGRPTSAQGYGILNGSAMDAWAAVTTSAQLRAIIGDETGSGSLVFANSPTLVTPNIGAAVGASLSVSGNLTASGTGIVYAVSETNAAEFLAWTYNDTAFPVISGFRARGTIAAPTAVMNDDSLLQFGGGGYNGVAFPPANAGEIWAEASQNWSVGANGARLAFYVTPNGTSAVDHIRAMWLENNGRLALGLERPDMPLAKLTVKDSGNSFAAFIAGSGSANGVAIGTSGGIAQINGYSEVNDAIGTVQTLALQAQGGNLSIGNATTVATINGSTASTTTLNGAFVVGTGTAGTSVGIGGGVIRTGGNAHIGGNIIIGSPGNVTNTRMDVYEPSNTFAATFRGQGQSNMVAIGTSGSGLAQINAYNQSFGAVQQLGLQSQGGNLTIGNAGTVTSHVGTTEATTAGAASITTQGGIYAAKKIISASSISPSASTVTWTAGSGSPEGVVTATPGSLYTRTDGGAATCFYVKESGTGNTGWIAK